MEILKANLFQRFFEEKKYLALKNLLYNYRLRKRAVKNALADQTPSLLLEVGSGISPVVTDSRRIVYTDISHTALAELRENVGTGFYVVCDATRLPFKDGTFSHLISSEVLEHVKNDQKAVTEFGRVLSPDGHAVLTFPHRKFYFAVDDSFVKHCRRYELEEMTKRLGKAGFDVTDVRKVLGPLDKLTMCVAVLTFRVFRKVHFPWKRKFALPRLKKISLILFGVLNWGFSGLVWLDAKIWPRSLSTTLLIKAIKK